MTTINADANMLAVLGQAKELAEVRDASGKVVGFFAPIAQPQASAYANAAAHIDFAAIQRAKEGKGPNRSTAEVLARLDALEKS